MKQHLKLFIITLLVLIPLATISHAFVSGYNNPIDGPSGDSKEQVPITIGTTPQAKNGGLTIVAPFIARGLAWFQGDTYINGFIAGIRPDAHDSVIAFGDVSHTVSVETTGTVWTKTDMQSDTLSPGGKVCADANGKLVLCSNPAGPGNCPNGTIPSGNGGCIEAPCVAFVTFEGAARHGLIRYVGEQSHGTLTVTATLEGLMNHVPPDGLERDVVFTIPQDSTVSYFNNQACNVRLPGSQSDGCGIEGTSGFDHGYTSSVVPDFIPNKGRICLQVPL